MTRYTEKGAKKTADLYITTDLTGPPIAPIPSLLGGMGFLGGLTDLITYLPFMICRHIYAYYIWELRNETLAFYAGIMYPLTNSPMN